MMKINGYGIVMRKADIFYLNQIQHSIHNYHVLKMLKNMDTQKSQYCHFFYIFPMFGEKAGYGINVMIVDIL